MSLLEEIKKLRELEQQADCGPWYAGVHPDDCDMCEDCDPDEEGLCDNPIRPGAVQVIDPDVIYSVYSNLDTHTLPNCQLTAALRNLAPAMLEVLGMFREGDGLHAKLAIAALEFSRQVFVIAGKLSEEEIDNAIDAVRRFQQMSALMEKEEREG